MSVLSLSRIKYLRATLEDEDISTAELAEIDDAFLQIPKSELPEPRENAAAHDKLDELEKRISPLERELYSFVSENFGASEADDPCYDLGEMANYIESKFEVRKRT